MPSQSSKPAKPYPEFPLTPHASGQFCKKIRGRIYYFGTDWREALSKYKRQVDDIQSGVGQIDESEGGLTVKDLCNQYLAWMEGLVKTGERSKLHFDDSLRVCKTIAAFFGNRDVESLRPIHFQRFRAHLAEGVSLLTLKNRISRCRSVFSFSIKAELIEGRIHWGKSFDRPESKALAKERERKREKHGKRHFEPEQVKAILGVADDELRAMVLLGINCGFGNQDIIDLDWNNLDLVNGIATLSRSKTGIARETPLWKETVAALQALRIGAAGAAPVFTIRSGGRYGQRLNANIISMRFREVLDAMGVYRPGLSFYTLRHCTQTIGDESGQFIAVKAIMGHAAGDMSGQYREHVSMDRKREVTEYIRAWLFGDGGKEERSTTLRVVG